MLKLMCQLISRNELIIFTKLKMCLLQHLISSLSSTGNKIWVYETCASLQSVFVYLVHSGPQEVMDTHPGLTSLWWALLMRVHPMVLRCTTEDVSLVEVIWA